MKLIYIPLAVAALAAGASSDLSPSLSFAPSQASLSAQTWNIQYSPGMPAHPVAVAGGWYFDFPAPRCGGADVCSVHYVTTPVKMSVTTSAQITAIFQVTSSGTPIFNYQLNPNNTCDYPAHARLYLQRTGDDLSGQGDYEFYRWFSSEGAYRLAAGSEQLSVALTPGQWTSVFGKR